MVEIIKTATAEHHDPEFLPQAMLHPYPNKQIIIAAGEGAKAALSACE
jgi:alkyl hydroperoxide reductase subunit AhpF